MQDSPGIKQTKESITLFPMDQKKVVRTIPSPQTPGKKHDQKDKKKKNTSLEFSN